MSQPLIFITGATGFLGSHATKKALERGYRVRLSVRKEAQIEDTRRRFSQWADQVDIVLIPDLSDSAAIEKVLGDVDHIFHIASPMPGQGDDFKTGYVDPAMNTTTAMLNAASKVPTVKTVIVESTISIVISPEDGMTLADMENFPFPEGFLGDMTKYHYSKVFAHKATKEWFEQHQPPFQLFTIHPTSILGPDLLQKDEKPRSVNSLFMRALMTEAVSLPSSIVDVRDVAEVHVRLIESPPSVDKSQIKEIVAAAKKTSWDDMAGFVRENYPNFPVKISGNYDIAIEPDTKFAEEVLGIKWIPMRETMKDLLNQQEDMQKKHGKTWNDVKELPLQM